jgi:alcohol dehydrogenase class IV
METFDLLRLDRVRWLVPGTDDDLPTAVGAELACRRSRRPLVVASKTLNRKTYVVGGLLDALDIDRIAVFDETSEHVPRDAVLACVEAIRQARADCVVTVGGGTPIDTVKVALLALAAGIADGDGFDRFAVRTVPDGTRHVEPTPPPPLRQVVVPTTLSGAGFSDLAGCVDPATRVKQLFTAPLIGSAAVLLDPAVTVHTPDDLWASTGIRALDHAVESLCSSRPTHLTDATALHAVRLLASSLRRTRADRTDLAARLDSQHAVWLACAGLNRVPWGASHGIGHQLGAVAGVPHAYCSCVMLPHVLAYNQPVTAERQRAIRAALTDDEAMTAGEAVAQLVADLGLPERLRDVGVRHEQLATIAELSVPNMFVRQNPRPLDADRILGLLESAF